MTNGKRGKPVSRPSASRSGAIVISTLVGGKVADVFVVLFFFFFSNFPPITGDDVLDSRFEF